MCIYSKVDKCTVVYSIQWHTIQQYEQTIHRNVDVLDKKKPHTKKYYMTPFV